MEVLESELCVGVVGSHMTCPFWFRMLRFGVPYEEGFSLEGDEYRVGVDCVWKFVMRCFGDPLLVALICLEGEERMVGCLGFGGGSSALDDLLYCLKIFFRLGARD